MLNTDPSINKPINIKLGLENQYGSNDGSVDGTMSKVKGSRKNLKQNKAMTNVRSSTNIRSPKFGKERGIGSITVDDMSIQDL